MNVYRISDVGLVRSHNEDACDGGLLPNGAWTVVCDGMGGARGGEIASRTAVKTIAEQLTENYQEDCSDNAVKYLISSAVYEANTEIYEMAQNNDDLYGMGTTVVVAVVTNGIAHITHAGDSRAYLITADGIRQLTVDHSMVQELVNLGDLTQEEAKVHPQKNIITRALGVHAIIELDYEEYHLEQENKLLLCTDGLTNYVDAEQIHRLSRELDGNAFLEKLVELAKDGGGGDNITVAMIEN